ncbi:Molybdenum cofactor synthesis domain protein [Methanocaldococcus lauensis]|uniref:molybdopterin molybdotransferase n=1 Tax=Methanocaldococcus lauensis TaxID=2546128 RepID=A0A8D6PXC4_9EURY|nr:molybdopterin biosynthesis protein [Methanocaldococcus lauensis]CAB3289758.1 Molybdenum cofactor synthesis domain protein [Methanocaldococcus lauensis]
MRRYLKLHSIDEAKFIVNNYIDKLKNEIEEVDLFNAIGRVLAEDVFSDVDIPPYDRAKMDGYAVKAEDTYEADENNPIELKIIDSLKAGEIKDIEIKNGECVEIATGAVIPKGSNAVVMVEYTEKKDNKVLIYKAVPPMENIQFTGSDIMTGELVLRKNTKLTPRDIGVLAAIGRNKVKVYKKLKFGIISTGNELISPGEPLKFGKIYDINTYTLASYIKNLGYDFEFFGISKDDVEDLKEKIKKALKKCDIILLSGGTSAGVGDLTETAIKELGGEILIHGIKIKPGKPTIIGKIDNKLIVGLPGYPTSCLTIFDVLFGDKKNVVKAKFPLRYISAKGRVEYLPVILVKHKNGYSAYPITKGSGAITSLSEADGYIVVEENKEILENEEVNVYLFGDVKVGLNIIGSHCIGIDLILKETNLMAKTINVGSLGGLLAIKRGESDISGIHLLDEKTNEYNIPFLERYNVKDAVLVRGYIREQGFMFRKEFNFKTIEDILKNIYNLEFINRNKGSGTRILFDKFLKENKINPKEIKGYNIEAKTHSAVATAVAMKKADIGLGIKTVAEQYGLGFIKLADEHYDFLIRKERFNDEDVKKFIEGLKKVKLPFEKPENCGEVIWEN